MNPFQRLRKECGLTIKAFCETYGFSKQSIIGIEAGMYPELSDRMIISMGHACHTHNVDAATTLLESYGVPRLQDAYLEWCQAERRYAGHILAMYRPDVGTATRSPMQLLVDDTVGSVQGFAKRLKVPQATLFRYASGKQVTMPKSIETALRQVKYPYLSELIGMQANWVNGYR